MKAFVKFLLSIYFAIFYKVELVGLENVPKSGSVIMCSNHIGQLDMFFIGYKNKRMVRYMAKEELFKIPLVSSFIRWAGAFPVKRGKADIQSIRTALNLLNEGEMLGIFPEGTRTKANKNIKIKPGVALIAIKSGAPILPVAISGSYKLFSKVKVVFGETFVLNHDSEKNFKSDELREISKDIMQNVYNLMG